MTRVKPLSGGRHHFQKVMGRLTFEDVPLRRPKRERDGNAAGLGQPRAALGGTEFVQQCSAITGRALAFLCSGRKLFKATCSCAVCVLLMCSDVTASELSRLPRLQTKRQFDFLNCNKTLDLKYANPELSFPSMGCYQQTQLAIQKTTLYSLEQTGWMDLRSTCIC